MNNQELVLDSTIKITSTSWSDDELLTYILIHCGSADLNISSEEEAYITSRVSQDLYHQMLTIYLNDTEQDRIYKIKDAYDDHIYNNNETDVLYEEMHNLFHIDGDYDKLEQAVFRKLDTILS